MTVTSGAQPGRTPGAFRRFLVSWGHYSLTWGAYVLPVLFGTYLVKWWWPDPTGREIVAWLTLILGGAGMVSLIWAQHVHDRSLCLRCLNAAPMLNPQDAVDRHRPKLALIHNTPRKRLPTVAALVPLGAIVLVPIRPDHWLLRVVATVAGLIGMAALTHMNRCVLLHRRLQPWCPWCPHGRGDHDAPAVQPQPQPTGTVN